MQQPLRITFRGLERSEAIESVVRAKAAKLERFHGRITGCHVIIDAPHRQHHTGRVYDVHIDVTVPGAEIVASRDPGMNHAHEDVYVAIRDAFDAVSRQLEDCVRVRRGRVKRHEAPSRGRVLHLFENDGYGFLESEDGLEIYFHRNAVLGGRFRELAVGLPVRYVLAEGEGVHGPQASTVELLD